MSHAASGDGRSTAAVVAPTVVAAVSAGGDAGQKVVMAAPSTVTIATQQQQLPVTVQVNPLSVITVFDVIVCVQLS